MFENDFLVTYLMSQKSINVQSTSVYGDVEIRPHTQDTDLEIDILKKSAIHRREKIEDYQFCARVSVIVNSPDQYTALRIADDKFTEVFDLMAMSNPISKLERSSIGLTKCLQTGQLEPITDWKLDGSMAFIVPDNLQKFSTENFLLSDNTELSQRLIRAAHWMRNASHEHNQQLSLLFHWFAVEALFKRKESESVEGVLRWFLGFPNGKGAQELSRATIESLNQIPKYQYWKNKIPFILNEIRNFRNSSVHHGFRKIEMPAAKLSIYSELVGVASHRSVLAVQKALINNIVSIDEFLEFIPVIFEESGDIYCSIFKFVKDTSIYKLNQLNNCS